jgi:hypothetical protein
MPRSVPGGWASGEAALKDSLDGATDVWAAVAFVTQGGVNVLHKILKDLPGPPPPIEIVARAAPVTEPAALIRLRKELQVQVSVVSGTRAQRYHPKLWLIDAGDELRVLSGSGNLTEGGLNGNDEQFEVWSVNGEEAEVQRRRFAMLTKDAEPLEVFEETPRWQRWVEQETERKALAKEHDRQLILIEAAEKDLRVDLETLYEDMAGQLRKKNGHVYNRSGFRLVIRGHKGPKTPVAIISSLCREMTPGFERARRNERLDLAAEQLVVDPTKSYHPLIPAEVREASATRLAEAAEPG